jgi:Flp pilus assembly protein CpaB
VSSIPFPTRDASSHLQPRRRRLRVPMLILGLLLVLGCGLSFGVVLTQVGRQHQVLVLADSVTAGHVLTASDLRLATVSQGTSGIDFIGAAEQSSVIGRPVAVALPAGAPLVPSDLGSPLPAQGEAVVAVLVKPGQAPPALAPGASVWIVVTGGSGSGPAAAGSSPAAALAPVAAVVTAVDTPTNQVTQGEIVSLQLPADDVQAVSAAGAAGQVSLALVAPGS